MVYFYEVRTGEGIAGGSEFGMCTTPLSTCMGIAMVNTATKRAGLYHYPGGALNHKAVIQAIFMMHNDLRPNQIRLTPAAVGDPVDLMFGGSAERSPDGKQDIRNVLAVLGKLGTADVAELDAQGLARFYWRSEAPVYNGSDFRAGLRGGITSQIEEEFKVQPRVLQGSVAYYGADSTRANRMRSRGIVTETKGA